MKQLAQYQDGRLELQDVPPPVAPPGGILVRTSCSVISPGTEKMKVEQARMSLLQKARARPDQVRKVIETAKTLGWKAAMQKVRNRLESPSPLGYSATGVIVAVDELNTRFRVGDRVACGGAECAFHAEMIAVPDLLAAPVPNSVEDWQAAYTTLASISMEAVRQSAARLGERVLVMGQGLVGLLATSLLKAAGARVMGVDYVSSRLQTSLAMGAERVVNPAQSKLDDEVRAWTDGYGVDAVLLCVGGKGADAADQAISALRDRGVMVIVGIYDAELSWKTAYMKDIQVRYSRSYGPGRYDPKYEWGGQDYPIGHVRWTENRNFESCLHLMKSGALDLRPVTTRRARFDDALSVYDELMQAGNADIGVVLEYGREQGAGSGDADVDEAKISIQTKPHENAELRTDQRSSGVDETKALESAADDFRRDSSSVRAQPASQALRGRTNEITEAYARLSDHNTSSPKLVAPCPALHAIGAGNFARTMLLPHVKGRIALGTIINATGLSAHHVKEKFGFTNAETDSTKVFAQPNDAVMIGTRHHLHAPLVLRGLQANQHVFVEKPMCLTRDELAQIDNAMLTSQGSVMVGFNRRFAPATVELKKLLTKTPGPKSMAYHVFAGPLAPDHWYANLDESGGRVLGEACHMMDFACYVLDSKPVRVTAQTVWPAQGRNPFPDSVTAQVEFSNGSSFQLIYSAEGDFAFPKETFRVFGSGIVAECENFMKLSVFHRRKEAVKKFASKGHAEEMAAWLAFLNAKAAHPMPYEQSRQSMSLTFAVLDAIRERQSIALD